jgi:hypothetical protein
MLGHPKAALPQICLFLSIFAQVFPLQRRDTQDTRIKLINYCSILYKEKLAIELLQESIDFLKSKY